MRKKSIAITVIIFTAVLIAGLIYIKNSFRKGSDDLDSSFVPISADELIYEETLSPNEQYVTSKDEVVYYEVKVYQKNDYSIIVCANANTAFFDRMQYVVDYDKKISESDITILWTTLMGNTQSTEEDQIVLADISILFGNEVFSQRKINFFNKGMDIIIDTLKKNAD